MNMSNTRTFRAPAIAVSLLMLAACTSDPQNVEADYGNSVRHMVEAQTANPSAPADSAAIDHGDGTRVNAAVEVYRKPAGDAYQDVSRVSGAATITPRAFPDVELTLAEIFA